MNLENSYNLLCAKILIYKTLLYLVVGYQC